MLDTLININSNPGVVNIDWLNTAIYFTIGLIATFLYFWFIIRSGNMEQDTFKEFFSIKKNQNTLYLHLIIYVAFITIWLLEGGVFVFELIGNIVKALCMIVSWDISGALKDLYSYINNLFPKGHLNISTLFLGGGMTYFIRNVIPAIKNWLVAKFKSK